MELSRTRISKNRKADVSESVYWIINIVIVAVTILSVSLSMSSAENSNTNTLGYEVKMLNERIISGFAYSDPISLSKDYHTIDVLTFTETNLKDQITTDKDIGIKVTLEYNNQKKEIFYNKDNYDIYKIFSTFKTEKEIEILDSGNRFFGKIIVEQVGKKGVVSDE